MPYNGLKVGISVAALVVAASQLTPGVDQVTGLGSGEAWAQADEKACEKAAIQTTTGDPEAQVFIGYSGQETDKESGSPGTSTAETTTTTAAPAAKGCDPVGTKTETTYTDGPGQSPFEKHDSCEATGTLTC